MVPYDGGAFNYFVNRMLGANLRIRSFSRGHLLRISMEHPYP